MGVRIIDGRGKAALYDSTTNTAFGPMFTGLDAHDQATHFLDWLNNDAREYDTQELLDHHVRWSAENLDPDYGELTASAAAHVVTLL